MISGQVFLGTSIAAIDATTDAVEFLISFSSVSRQERTVFLIVVLSSSSSPIHKF